MLSKSAKANSLFFETWRCKAIGEQSPLVRTHTYIPQKRKMVAFHQCFPLHSYYWELTIDAASYPMYSFFISTVQAKG